MNAISIALARRPAFADPLARHPVVSEAEFLAARMQLLEREKAYTRLRDELVRRRRALPWVRVIKSYIFDTPTGRRGLADLFGDNSQLVIQHFMFGPDWEEGCIGCSLAADGNDGALPHLIHHDVSFAAVSRAPLEKITAFKQRMGWRFPWVSSFSSDFNHDFHVSFTPGERAAGKVHYNYRERPDLEMDEMPGYSVFHKNAAGQIFHTYSTYERGGEPFIAAYHFLDMTPKGRDEHGPGADLMQWAQLHDAYDDASAAHTCRGAVAAEKRA